jgi:hypothetical protein
MDAQKNSVVMQTWRDSVPWERLQRRGWFGAGALIVLMVFLAADFNTGGIRLANALPFVLGCGLLNFWTFRFGQATQATGSARKVRLRALVTELVVVAGLYGVWCTGLMERLFFLPRIPSLSANVTRTLPNGERWIVLREAEFTHTKLITAPDCAALVYGPKAPPAVKQGSVDALGGGWYRHLWTADSDEAREVSSRKN